MPSWTVNKKAVLAILKRNRQEGKLPISMAQVATIAGMERHAFYRLLNNSYNTTLKSVARVAHALECAPCDITTYRKGKHRAKQGSGVIDRAE